MQKKKEKDNLKNITEFKGEYKKQWESYWKWIISTIHPALSQALEVPLR